MLKDDRPSTSPSIYVQIVGTAAVTDGCGQLGPVHTNPIIPVPPGGLSTASYPKSIGETWYGIFEAAGETKALNVADLACPTWGLSNPMTDSAGGIYETIGHPFNPLVAPPSELLYFDPSWVNCSYVASLYGWLLVPGIYDPPVALTPMAGLSPFSPTSPPPAPATLTKATSTTAVHPAQPINTPSPSTPTMTLPPPPTLTPLPPTKDPGKPTPTDPGHSTTVDPGHSSMADPKQSSAVDPGYSSAVNLGQSSIADPSSNSLPVVNPHPVLDPGSPSSGSHTSAQQPSQGIGGIIYSAFGDPSNGPSPITSAQPVAPTSGLMIYGSVFPANPSTLSVGGTTISQGGPAVTISGTLVSLAPSGVLVIGTSSIHILGPSVPTPSPMIVTVGGQTITANPSAIVFSGSTLLPGGPALTISGTPISLAPSGVLIIGTSTLTLAHSPTPAPLPSIITIANQPLTAYPGSLLFSNSTLTPSASALTISGTPVSFGASGILVVGTSTMQLQLQPQSSGGVGNGSIEPFLGGARRIGVGWEGLVAAVGMGFGAGWMRLWLWG